MSARQRIRGGQLISIYRGYYSCVGSYYFALAEDKLKQVSYGSYSLMRSRLMGLLVLVHGAAVELRALSSSPH
ncbi:uncharacterized protein BCR38DRAFT_442382 [Pseudomassariella vexata]|uniref:Uncharacterized protein n=1 Tax=Pseudomassariella vexata TaxID=1141098 RepID=A0A1Y2DNJ7_9PEZI|nr:uncharacterized protein BCR38DRAFT_442382 [Pseudomassariella vexata]ORY60749.1 hypothetical protein BCR38DRAFT_442382 [Pseudomassariella vexata]